MPSRMVVAALALSAPCLAPVPGAACIGPGAGLGIIGRPRGSRSASHSCWRSRADLPPLRMLAKRRRTAPARSRPTRSAKLSIAEAGGQDRSPLQRLAPHQPAGRQHAHRVAHEELLERRDPVDQAEAELAGQAQRQQVIAEQPVESVSDRDQRRESKRRQRS